MWFWDLLQSGVAIVWFIFGLIAIFTIVVIIMKKSVISKNLKLADAAVESGDYSTALTGYKNILYTICGIEKIVEPFPNQIIKGMNKNGYETLNKIEQVYLKQNSKFDKDSILAIFNEIEVLSKDSSLVQKSGVPYEKGERIFKKIKSRLSEVLKAI